MSVLLVAPGRAMLADTRRPALWGPLRGSGGGGGTGGGTPAGIPNLAGWWDASGPAQLADANGIPVIGWGSSVGSVVDRSVAGVPLTAFFGRGTGTLPIAAPRLSGLLGGVGRSTVTPPALPSSGVQVPALDPDQGLALAAAQFGSGAAWTRALVWSRPNWRQASGKDTAPVALLTIGGTVVLQADSAAGSGRLILFPGASQTVLATTLTRRHTHAVVLRHTPGGGVDVWLDGNQVASGAANPLGASVSARLLLLHDGTAAGGAQCWFHEAASWDRSLGAPEIATLLAYLGRWTVGPRKGVQLLVVGQSNAGNGLNDGAWHVLAAGVAWHLGALAYGAIGNYGSPPAATCVGGMALYDVRVPPNTGSVYLYGSFLQNPADGSDPSTYAVGADGLAVQTYVGQQAAADVADIAAILWPWSESDSCRAYSEKAFYQDGAKNYLAKLRGYLGRSAASLPMIWWNAMPFWTDDGVQMVREVAAAVAADPAQNVIIGWPQTADVDPRSGDNSHIAQADNIKLGRRAAPIVARGILAASGGDTLAAIPAGIPTVGGPRITHAWKQDATHVVLTVQHDTGDDLLLPGTAAAGTGFAVLDGGSLASHGTPIQATACARVDATHLRATLAAALTNPAASCLLFYPWGSTRIGAGNAVTDNASLKPKPAGWDIGGDLGSDWNQDMPLAATSAPVALSDTA